MNIQIIIATIESIMAMKDNSLGKKKPLDCFVMEGLPERELLWEGGDDFTAIPIARAGVWEMEI